MSDFTWIVMVIAGAREMTRAAIADCLAQSVPTKLLLVNQGVDSAFREELERISEQDESRILLWSHEPPMPSLSATWNRALQFCWESGATEALVVNNDVRIAPQTVERLLEGLRRTEAMFVSAVAVAEAQFSQELPPLDIRSRGGPDFSCFLITKACHDWVEFDQGHIPCYAEDCTFHREMMLTGEGERIFSLNIPYWHIGGGSGTLKSMTPDARAALERRIEGSRQYYMRAWGGPINHERFTIKGDAETDQDGVTNPELQALALVHGSGRASSDDAADTAIPGSPTPC